MKDLLKKLITENVNTTVCLQKHFSDSLDYQNSLSQNLNSLNSHANAHQNALNLAQMSHIENKMKDLKNDALSAKNATLSHNFAIPAGMTNANTIRKHIRDTLDKFHAPKCHISLMSKTPRDNKISVLLQCPDFETKSTLIDCLKREGIKTSTYNTPSLHSFFSKARKLYIDAKIEKHDIPPKERHIMIKTNYSCKKIVVLLKKANENEWIHLETLNFPTPKKWTSDTYPQPCSSSYIDIDKAIPDDF